MPAVYRYERSGTMHGLFRVRGFTQAGRHARKHGLCLALNGILTHLPGLCAG